MGSGGGLDHCSMSGAETPQQVKTAAEERTGFQEMSYKLIIINKKESPSYAAPEEAKQTVSVPLL